MSSDLLFQIQAPPPPEAKPVQVYQSKQTSSGQSSQTSNSAQTDQDAQKADESFEALMKRLQKSRTDSTQDDQGSAATADLNAALALHAQAQGPDAGLADESALDIDPDNQDLAATIQALSDHIKHLLEDGDQSTDEDQSKTAQDAALSTSADDATQAQKDLLDLIAALQDALQTQAQQPTDDKADAEKFAELLQNLKDLLGADNEDLSASGLTPSELQELQKQLQALLRDEADRKNLERLNALAAQSLNIVAPEHVETAALTKEQTVSVSTDNAESATDRYDMRYDLRYQQGALSGSETVDGDGFRSSLKGAQGNDLLGASADKAAQSAQQTQGGATPLPAFMAPGSDPSLSFDPLLDQTALQSSSASAAGAAHMQQTSLSAQASLIAQSHSAGQTSPATQTVMATIQKAVKGGEDTNIKLQLDPPELGRVEVKMSFNKDNAAKVVLTAEKPETFMMLQRDSHVLQQALQNAGLDADGSSLSFELAQDGYDFGQGDGGQGSRSNSQNAGANGLDTDGLIETTMDWSVDPETGRMHYNIMV